MGHPTFQPMYDLKNGPHYFLPNLSFKPIMIGVIIVVGLHNGMLVMRTKVC